MKSPVVLALITLVLVLLLVPLTAVGTGWAAPEDLEDLCELFPFLPGCP